MERGRQSDDYSTFEKDRHKGTEYVGKTQEGPSPSL